MRVCLLPLKIELRQPTVNLLHFANRLREIAPHQPDFVLLPECAFSGYLYELGDFQQFAEPVPGRITTCVAELAKRYRCSIGFGMLEAAPQGVYSSAVLVDRTGQIIGIQRKVSEQPPFIQGDSIQPIRTEMGPMTILICGDLFAEAARAQIHPSTRVLFAPMARSFAGKSPDLDRWVAVERQAYLDEVKKAGVLTFLVNALENTPADASFGGALVVSPAGEVLAESPHGTDEALVFEFSP